MTRVIYRRMLVRLPHIDKGNEMKTDVSNTHNRCEISIRWKLFKTRTDPTPGLFCRCHGVFLDWLNDSVALDLIDNHKVPVEPWIELKKKKSPLTLTAAVNSKSLRTRKAKRKKVKQAEQSYKLKTGQNML